jgi:hypothetical protein
MNTRLPTRTNDKIGHRTNRHALKGVTDNTGRSGVRTSGVGDGLQTVPKKKNR